MEGFDALSSAFGVDNVDDNFNKEVSEVTANIQLIEAKTNDIINQTKAPALFQDQEFLRTELRSLIMSARTIMCKVEQDIKIGAEPRKIEVYSKLVDAIGKQYVTLMELNKNIFDAQVQTNTVDIHNIGNNKISLSSDQLLDMINKASEKSEMNQIDGTFEIVDENIPSKKFDKKKDDGE